MNTATITTTRKLTTLTMSDGRAINLPAQVPGVSVSTQTALERALEWATADDIHAELVAHWQDADRVGATPEQVVYHFVTWLAMAGDWEDLLDIL
jgi:hypothetical protein